MISRLYLFLCDDARFIRERVFIEEQGFTEEFDDTDKRSLHMVAYTDTGEPCGTGRMFTDGNKIYTIGRIAVLKSLRGTGTGAYIVSRLCSEAARCGAKQIILWAQEYASGFYEKSGFKKTNETMTEDGVLHIKMVRFI